MDYTSSWCPTCDRQILPKRFQVPVLTTPPPPPSSPSRKQKSNQQSRTRPSGLLQGTGRVKPNGSIKRPSPPLIQQQQQHQQQQQPIKLRTVIDQSPIPLYCSDKCHLADMPNLERHTGSETESDSATSSSGSHSSDSTPMSPSIATLAAIYGFPPLPPPPPTFEDTSSASDFDYPHEYNSGIMMAGKRIAALCARPPKRPQPGAYTQVAEPPKPIPGWTDGSNAWRSSVYSFTAPKSAADPFSSESKPQTPVSFSQRSSQSTISTSRPSPTSPSADDMLTKFSMSFNRRSESRSSLYSSSPVSPHSPPSASSAPRRERSILKRGAEGKLLVPDVKLKVRSESSASLSSACSATSSRRCAQSPLTRYGSDISDEDAQTQRCDSATSFPSVKKRPVVETRSWSYDNLKTYPIMPLPCKKEKRVEKRVVDGVEVEVEVEVVVQEPLKRLFNFPLPWEEGQQVSCRRSLD